MLKPKSGFTIVELLIVIVIISILTVVAIVAYNGIQNRAYNNTVQTDLRNTAQSLHIYFIDKGTYPSTISQLISETGVSASPRMNIKISKSAYSTNRLNFIYCYGNSNVGYGLIAQSKGGQAYYINSTTSTPQALSNFPVAQADACPLSGAGGAGQWGYNSGWESWVQG